MTHSRTECLLLVPLAATLLMYNQIVAQPNVVSAKQGTTMLLQMDNRGAMGKVSYLTSTHPDSIGLEFPAGSRIEHLYAAGMWIGGLIDTTISGTGEKIRVVSTVYEGYAGPLYEFYPGPAPADSIWKVYGQGAPKPPGWDAYWWSSLAYTPVADQNFFCQYTDYYERPAGHIPQNLKVIQSSFTWDSPLNEGIEIIRYHIINNSQRVVDSCYVGMFADASVGPSGVPNYYIRNYTGFYLSSRLAFVHNPVDSGSTPFGISLLDPFASERLTFQRYHLANSPPTDRAKYGVMSSGGIAPDEFPSLSDTRFLLAIGPFVLQPSDTMRFAVAIVCAYNLTGLQHAAIQALNLYNNLVLSVEQHGDGKPNEFELAQNYPNPFNSTTTISYQLPTAAQVTLKVHDVLGREVATLVNERRNAGRYSARFDASGQASGVYFYRLKTSNGLSAVRKMILIR